MLQDLREGSSMLLAGVKKLFPLYVESECYNTCIRMRFAFKTFVLSLFLFFSANIEGVRTKDLYSKYGLNLDDWRLRRKLFDTTNVNYLKKQEVCSLQKWKLFLKARICFKKSNINCISVKIGKKEKTFKRKDLPKKRNFSLEERVTLWDEAKSFWKDDHFRWKICSLLLYILDWLIFSFRGVLILLIILLSLVLIYIKKCWLW